MNNIDIIDKINQIFSNNPTTSICIFIDGPWGVGKTYTIDMFKQKFVDSYEVKYISLFGKENIKDVEKGLLIQLIKIFNKVNKAATRIKNPLKHEAEIRIFGNTFKSLTKGIFKKTIGIDFSLSQQLDNIAIEMVSYENSKDTKRIILCIDDLERKSDKFDTKDLMGLLERAKSKFDIILIGNRSKLDSSKIFDEYKEKIIDYLLTIDEPSAAVLETLVLNKFGALNEPLRKSIIKAYTDSSGLYYDDENQSLEKAKSNSDLLNLRIFIKYIDLVYRVNEEMKALLNSEIIEPNMQILSMCREIICLYYLPPKVKKSTSTKANYDRNKIHEVLENIFLYKDYDIECLIENVKYQTEVRKDIIQLFRIHELNEIEYHELINKIENKISIQDIDYFINQDNVVTLYDVLNELGISEEFKVSLSDICKSLLHLDINIKPKLIDSEDYITVNSFSWSPCSTNTESFIKEINRHNNQKHKEFMMSEYENAISKKDFKVINTILSKLYVDDIINFEMIFNLAFKELDRAFDKDIWNVILTLIKRTNHEIIKDYFIDKADLEHNIVIKKRYYVLNEVLEEMILIEERMKEQSMDNSDF